MVVLLEIGAFLNWVIFLECWGFWYFGGCKPFSGGLCCCLRCVWLFGNGLVVLGNGSVVMANTFSGIAQ